MIGKIISINACYVVCVLKMISNITTIKITAIARQFGDGVPEVDKFCG